MQQRQIEEANKRIEKLADENARLKAELEHFRQMQSDQSAELLPKNSAPMPTEPAPPTRPSQSEGQPEPELNPAAAAGSERLVQDTKDKIDSMDKELLEGLYSIPPH